MSTATDTTLVSNTYDLGTLKFWALGDRILIEEDKFRSGYECTVCDGAGKIACPDCDGSGKSARVASARCSGCSGEASVTCPDCNGRGGLLVAPEVSQRRPTTGVVRSCGPDCNTLHIGDNVLYSNFAGYVLDLNRAGRPVSLRILHETEILCAMDGQLDMRQLKGKNEIAEFGATHV